MQQIIIASTKKNDHRRRGRQWCNSCLSGRRTRTDANHFLQIPYKTALFKCHGSSNLVCILRVSGTVLDSSKLKGENLQGAHLIEDSLLWANHGELHFSIGITNIGLNIQVWRFSLLYILISVELLIWCQQTVFRDQKDPSVYQMSGVIRRQFTNTQ